MNLMNAQKILSKKSQKFLASRYSCWATTGTLFMSWNRLNFLIYPKVLKFRFEDLKTLETSVAVSTLIVKPQLLTS